MGKKIPLGACIMAPSSAIVTKPLTLEEKVEVLSRQVEDLFKAFHDVNNIRIKDKRLKNEFPLNPLNKDGVPIGLSLIGVSMRGGVHVLTVNSDGYYIGTTKHESLSSAAESVSGVRRSGWTYWKLPDGRTAKEAFGKI